MAKKKGSRKGKKNQRKNTDISDVEALLESERQEALQGGKLETRPDDAIFFVDKGPVDLPGPKARQEFWRAKLTRADEILKGNVHTQAFAKSKRRELKGPTVFEQKRLEKAAKAYLSHAAPAAKAAPHDLWDEPVVPKESENAYLEHLVPKQPKRATKGKPSIVPAVELPAPGESYKPAYEDHQDELGVALAQELKRQAKAAKERRQAESFARGFRQSNQPEPDMFAEPADIKAEPAALEDGSSGVKLEDGVAVKSEQGAKAKGHQDHIDRKTRTDRNKEKRKRQQAGKMRYQRSIELQRKDIDRVEQIVEQLEQKEATEAFRKEYKESVKDAHAAVPKKLGKHKYVEDPKVVLLSDELPKRLNTLKKVVDPLRDRFKSLQKRNIIEVRPRAMKRTRRYALVSYNKKNI